MNSQNTPVHIKLWHKDFWRMAVANMFLAISVYMLIPVMPHWMMEHGMTSIQTGCAMGAFGLGIFVFGVFCSFLIQYFRRNVVCIWSIVGIIACIAFLYYMRFIMSSKFAFDIILLQRLLLGAFFGLAQMILVSTLIIDTSESFQRTEANYSATWFSRFALSLGPVISIVLYKYFHIGGVLLGACFCALVSIVLIKLVKFPFRAPGENMHVYSLDRFLLPQGKWLFINLSLITTVIGMVFSIEQTVSFFGMVMVGFFFALLSQKFVFANAELKSEVVSGLILILMALLLMLNRSQNVVYYMAPLLIGLGIGLIASRFLLFFIKLSKHCQRGTSQSSYILSWEFGLALGLFIGYGAFYQQPRLLLLTAIIITIIAFLMYNLFTHNWYIKHKNR